MAKKTRDASRNLGEALASLPAPTTMPMALPPVHMTDGLRFKEIVAHSELQPQFCSVFQEHLIYLFYGGVFYRRFHQPSRRATELPVAFLFDPGVLQFVERYFPSDTGALRSMEERNYPEEAVGFRQRFSVPGGGDYTVPAKLIYYVFRTNDRYLFGNATAECRKLPSPFPELFRFISRDLSGIGVDQRQRRLEAQSKESIPLRNLVWVGYPDVFDREFALLLENIKPSVPDYYSYRVIPSMPPSEAAAILQTRAHDIVERYTKIPGRAA
jgi:hypothetical protein